MSSFFYFFFIFFIFLKIEFDDSFKDWRVELRKVMNCLRFLFGLRDSTLLFDSRQPKVMYCVRFQVWYCDSSPLFDGQHHDL